MCAKRTERYPTSSLNSFKLLGGMANSYTSESINTSLTFTYQTQAILNHENADVDFRAELLSLFSYLTVPHFRVNCKVQSSVQS